MVQAGTRANPERRVTRRLLHGDADAADARAQQLDAYMPRGVTARCWPGWLVSWSRCRRPSWLWLGPVQLDPWLADS